MNVLDLNMKIKERIVEEVNKVFEYNMQIFNELDQVGFILVREILEDGFFVYDGKGDMCKCFFYVVE